MTGVQTCALPIYKQSYYIVAADETEYAIRMFEFQKNEPVPEELSCLVKEVHDGMLDLCQDFAPLLVRFYEEGKIYPFWVKADFTNMPNGYYEVSDWHGFTFRMMIYGRAKLYIRQNIECRVQRLVDNKLRLELVQQDELSIIPFLTLSEISTISRNSSAFSRWFKLQIFTDSLFEEAYASYAKQRGEWILITLRILNEHISSWIQPESKRNELFLKAYKEVCLYLLEGSEFLKHCTEEERYSFQQQLSMYAQSADEYLEAVSLIQQGRDEERINQLLENMRISGYLYQPERKLKVMKCIFSLKPDMMDEKMQVIFDILLEGDPDNWITEPFRRALLQQLEFYIRESKPKVERWAVANSKDGQEILRKMIQALAIQLLLANDSDHYDRQLNRAMLYRYLTFVYDNNAAILLEKAFYCIANAGQAKLEYGWSDIKDIFLLALKLSYAMNMTVHQTNVTQSFEGRNARLRIMNNSVVLMPLRDAVHSHSVLPKDLLPWHNMQVQLNGNMEETLKQKSNDLRRYQRFWKEVENMLFYSEYVKKVKKDLKVLPLPKDVVTVRVMSQLTEEPNYFLCKVEDPNYKGAGLLNVKNIVRYNIYPDIHSFRSDDGKALLFKAEVQGINSEGELAFTMLTQLSDYIVESVSYGEEVVCLVTDVQEDKCVGISEWGFSVIVPIIEGMPELTTKSYIKVSLQETKKSGQVNAEFISEVYGDFTILNAFETLILNYSGEMIYEEVETEEEQQLAEVMMEPEYVRELIYMIDRMALLEKDYMKTYNYLAFDRLLSMMLDDSALVIYYTQRMKFIDLIQQFTLNGSIDNESLKKQGMDKEDMLKNYPLLQVRLTELKVISGLGDKKENAFLWETLRTAENEQIISLARLVLSYNLLDGFDMHAEKEEIRRRISRTLNMHIELPRQYSFGTEGQQREFKTSIIFPPDNGMQPDPIKQKHNILKVIGVFLKTTGGTLYLGVNNEGVAAGRSEDLKCFENSKDKCDLHVRNQIKESLGLVANSCIMIEWPDAGDKLVYAIVMQPSRHPIQLDDMLYVRQGSSTYPIDRETFENIFKKRLQVSDYKDVAATEEESQISGTAEVKSSGMSEPKEEKEKLPGIDDDVKLKDVKRHVKTSKLRQNIVDPFNDDFGVETIGYFHLLPDGEYMLSESEVWEDVQLSLAIQEKEEKGCLIVVYKSGRVMRVEIADLLKRNYQQHYKRYTGDDLFFVSPALKDDALLMVVRNYNDRYLMRLDDVTNLKSDTLQHEGEYLSTVEFREVTQCEIIPSSKKSSFKKIHNQKATSLGADSSSKWVDNELKMLRKLGLEI